MNKLYLITGPAGVGKTTVSTELAKRLKKSALIEGDTIYAFVVGGHVSPWLEGNQLDIFWENVYYLIENFLSHGYDVIFNYIIKDEIFEKLKKRFKNVDIKYTVLLADEETMIKRDKERPLDCQQGERSLILLNDFRNSNVDKKHKLETTYLSVDEIVDDIKNNDRYNVEEK